MRSSKLKIAVGVLFIISGLLLFTSTYQDNIISSCLSFVTIPLEQVVTGVSNSATDFLNLAQDKQRLENEILDLKQQLNHQRDLTLDYYEVKKENAQYAKYYEFKKDNPSLKFVPGAVVGRDATDIFGDFTIDVGKISGVSVNDPVITDNGLVGWVCQVTTNSSRVRTILSPETKVGVVDIVSNDAGVVSGGVPFCDDGLTRMVLIRNQNNMQSGDMVVTTGVSGRYPRNIKVGQIKSIERDEYDTSSYAVVEPFEDIKNIRDVFVVTSFNGKGEVTLDTSKTDS